MEDSPTIAATPSDEPELLEDLIRLQIQVFVSSVKLLQDRVKKTVKMLNQEKKKMELTVAMLRAHKDNMKKLESQVSKFSDLLQSHGRLEGLEQTLGLLASTMDKFGRRRSTAVEAFEHALAQLNNMRDAEEEEGVADGPGA